MPARVMLLILATALFVAIWSGDRRGRAKPLAAEPDVKTPAIPESAEPNEMSSIEYRAGIGPCDDFTPIVDIPETVPAVAKRPASLLRDEPLSPDDVPLPVDLSPGEYQVVSNRGHVFRMSYSAEELAERGVPHTLPRKNLYIVADGARRWHFIRVELPEVTIAGPPARPMERPAAETANPTNPATWNRIQASAQSTVQVVAQRWDNVAEELAAFQTTLRRVAFLGWKKTIGETAEFTIDAMHRSFRNWSNWPRRISSGMPAAERR